jgi:hypothetical protein
MLKFLEIRSKAFAPLPRDTAAKVATFQENLEPRQLWGGFFAPVDRKQSFRAGFSQAKLGNEKFLPTCELAERSPRGVRITF